MIHIQAAGGTDLYRQVATFAYGSFLEHGRGAVIVTQGEFLTHGDGRIEDSLMYVPDAKHADLLPPEVTDMIQDYNPDQECILAMVDSAGKAACVILTGQEMGSTPEQLFKNAFKAQQHVHVAPGTVVRIKEPIGDVEPGSFVFLGEEGAEMVLSRAGEDEDEDGDVVATDEIHRTHVDYRDSLEVTRMSVRI